MSRRMRLARVRDELPAAGPPGAGRLASATEHLRRFARRPWPEKRQALRFRFKAFWNRLLPGVPLPCRLECGAWWLAWNDEMGDGAFCRVYEPAELRFLERFLAPGMTVIDAGAHHGFYTLLASKKVSPRGRVIAFEPSPRELGRLRWHLRLNRSRNVWVEEAALGAQEGEGWLFIANGRRTGYNSLRHPEVHSRPTPITVRVTALDGFLARHRISSVDFIKLDIEGGELEALLGAARLLEHPLRPVILSEVQQEHASRWGHSAEEIVAFLRHRGYCWFRPHADGTLAAALNREDWSAALNLVAVPKERLGALAPLLGDPGAAGRQNAEAAC